MSDTNLASALAALQAELPRIGKDNTAQVKSDKGNYSYKYADLATISATVLPLAAKHGLSFTARPTLDDGGRFVLAYELLHTSGESRTGAYPLPASNSRAQDIGSAISYARRYTLCSVLGIAPDEDDDGASAPPASRAPVERHESAWDPIEQDALRAGYEAEIDDATTAEEVTAIAKRIASAKKGGELAPGTYNRLVGRGAKRRAELDLAAAQAAKEQSAEAVTP